MVEAGNHAAIHFVVLSVAVVGGSETEPKRLRLGSVHFLSETAFSGLGPRAGRRRRLTVPGNGSTAPRGADVELIVIQNKS